MAPAPLFSDILLSACQAQPLQLQRGGGTPWRSVNPVNTNSAEFRSTPLPEIGRGGSKIQPDRGSRNGTVHGQGAERVHGRFPPVFRKTVAMKFGPHGLKLAREEVSVAVFVIDRIDKVPTQNLV
jgi:hypothetical protein